jgi:ribosomal protein S18 acetylase RimI-like enzyme
MKLKIRKATIQDVHNLTILKQQVWISTYATEGIIDDFSKYVHTNYSLEKTQLAINDTSKICLIAETDNALIACVEIKLNPKCPIQKYNNSPEINEFYILERFQGKGIGKQILDVCFKTIKSLSYNSVWLTVYHKNKKAIDFYKKHSFINIGETNFILNQEKHKNYILFKHIDN